MCTCKAYKFRSCWYEHAKFEPVSVCFLARIGLRAKCQERIVNGHPEIPRHFPIIDETCDVCYPAQARREEQERKAQKSLKKEENEKRMLQEEQKAALQFSQKPFLVIAPTY
ncbi:hypothetical protein F5Y10DRAFT_197750 [Nemania abortiva]|nr:hypothetical protein F5Y10DRAFT_197750 [Nemania abortiva]